MFSKYSVITVIIVYPMHRGSAYVLCATPDDHVINYGLCRYVCPSG